jgi:hypothetical protein
MLEIEKKRKKKKENNELLCLKQPLVIRLAFSSLLERDYLAVGIDHD